jgi:uncharacterized cupredoxin-like copper-binding protein
MRRLRRTSRCLLAVATLLAIGLPNACSSTAAQELALPVFEVHLGHYTIEPAELTLPAGRFELIVTNVDAQLPHNLVLLKRSTQVLSPGQSQTIIVKRGEEPQVGDYTMFCDVPGHRQMGQHGIVHVVAAAPIATTA